MTPRLKVTVGFEGASVARANTICVPPAACEAKCLSRTKCARFQMFVGTRWLNPRCSTVVARRVLHAHTPIFSHSPEETPFPVQHTIAWGSHGTGMMLPMMWRAKGTAAPWEEEEERRRGGWEEGLRTQPI